MQRANLMQQERNDATIASVARIMDIPLDLWQMRPLASYRMHSAVLADWPNRLGVWWGALRQRIAASQASKEWFVPALIGVIAVASLLPCYGAGARVFGSLTLLAIGSLFFLQGARLSRDAIVAGTKNWRLHLGIGCTTFILFPLLGLGFIGLSPGILTPELQIGVLFVCALPSTVQSSIALTSIARGNVAGAICAATASNIIGVALTPMLLALMLRVQGAEIDLNGLWRIFAELILPFILGHSLRPRIGKWVDQNRAILAVTDRGSVLLVVYTAFSAAVIEGVWSRIPPITLIELVLIEGLLLLVVLSAIKFGGRLFAVPRSDEIAILFCGSQKSAITGVPMAHLLFAGPAAGMIVLPIIIYHQLQLWSGAWLARRYESTVIVTSPTEAAPCAARRRPQCERSRPIPLKGCSGVRTLPIAQRGAESQPRLGRLDVWSRRLLMVAIALVMGASTMFALQMAGPNTTAFFAGEGTMILPDSQ